MIISFDLDNVLVNLTKEERKIANKYNIKQYTKDWHFSNYPEDCRQEIFEMFKNPDIMCNLKPFPYAKKLIKWFQNRGDKIYIITSRHKNIYNETMEFVNKLFNINPVIVNYNESKLNPLKELNVDTWIDDSPNEMKEIQKLNIKCILISNKTTPYNHYARNFCFWLPNVKKLYEYLTNDEIFKEQ